MSLKDNLCRIRNNIDLACKKSGRNPEDVKIVAVTKTVDTDTINEAVALGLCDLGENRVQEFMSKYELVDKRARWHIIGHLQTNKVKYIADKVVMIHSVDSLRLAEEIDRQCKKHGRVMDVLIEINSGEENKNGIAPKDAPGLIESASKLENIRICGLMTMAPLAADENVRHEVFSRLKKLALDIDAKKYDNVSMKELSMGMSNDYSEAVEEGSTMIRPGRTLFRA